MDDLVIKLTGEIQNSNFETWKDDLLEQIKSVDKSLKSDSDFAEAAKSVKQFRAAEKALKAAKESAIDQAADINTLFDAIDAIAEETRQVRLSLDRQIKKRKEEIKDQSVQQGMALIEAYISEQSENFQLIDHDEFLNDDHFEEAIKGKASLKGMQSAVTKRAEELKQAIDAKAVQVKNNASVLESLQSDHKLLFQDRASLLAKTGDELNALIDQRVEAWEKEHADEATKSKKNVAKKNDEENAPDDSGSDTNQEQKDTPTDESVSPKLTWQIHISLTASKDQAHALLAQVQEQWDSEKEVEKIELVEQS